MVAKIEARGAILEGWSHITYCSTALFRNFCWAGQGHGRLAGEALGGVIFIVKSARSGVKGEEHEVDEKLHVV